MKAVYCGFGIKYLVSVLNRLKISTKFYLPQGLNKVNLDFLVYLHNNWHCQFDNSLKNN